MSKPAASRAWVCAFCIVPVIAIISVALLIFAPGHHGNGVGSTASLALHPGNVSPAARSGFQASFAALPLAFEQNHGQTDARVQYMARGDGYTLFLTPNDAVFSLRAPVSGDRDATSRLLQSLSKSSLSRHQTQQWSSAVVHMQLIGADSSAKVAGSEPLSGLANYFLGNDPGKWRRNVPRYSRVSYANVYPGVDMAFHGEQRQLEFDFLVAAGADPKAIGFHFTGGQDMKTDDRGNLVISSAAGAVLLHKPVAYQDENGSRQNVDARFALKANNQVGFELGNYDRTRELVIDPTVTYGYATFLGGTLEDDGFGVAFDSAGNAYVTGQTESADFPAVGGVSPNTYAGGFDVFVTKIKADGSGLVYSTYIGGSLDDSGTGIAVDASGDAFVVGGTQSINFPTTAGAFQTTIKSGASLNAFIIELNPAGSTLSYGTYLGGTVADAALGMALDSAGNVSVVGKTSSANFPLSISPPPLQSTVAGGFYAKLKLAGTGAHDLLFSTYLGGSAQDFASAVAVDSSGDAYVTGQTAGSFSGTPLNTYGGGPEDAFVIAIKTDGSAFLYSTYLGGSDIDIGDGIAVDSAGNAYVTGETASSTNFPLKSPEQPTFGGGAFDAFVTKLTPAGALVYSTFLGGNGTDEGASIAVDASGNAYVTGQTASSNFPTSNATQSTYGLGNSDAFVTELNAAGSALTFSTFLGGSGDEDVNGDLGGIAVDSAGANIYVTGDTSSTSGFPTTTGAFQTGYKGSTDAFVVKYSQAGSQTFSLTATALSPASVSPGGTATSTVTAASANGFTGSVTLACMVSPSVTAGPTCGTASATPGTPGTLTVSTTAASALLRDAPNGHSSPVFYAMFLPMAGISLMGITFRSIRARHKKLFAFLMIGMVVASLMLLPACSSNSSGGGGGGNAGTPAGSYTITVTGTASGASQTGTSPALTLTVN